MWRPVPTVLALAVLVLVVLWAAQRWLIYFPDGAPPSPAVVGLPTAELVAFTTSDGLRLEGWFVPPQSPASGDTIIVFNGNAGNRAHRAALAAAFAARGMACLLFDYRGYGGNPGLPSERGLTKDARAARAAVADRPDVDPARIVYFGESLGAAVAARLAAEHPPAALILRSPFSSLADVGAYHYPVLPVRWLLRDRYPVAEIVRQVQAPLLVVAGEDDRIVPPGSSEVVYEAAAGPKRIRLIPGADHNDEALADGPALLTAVDEFLAIRSVLSPSAPASPSLPAAP
jgi:fermentation-respiration switch protein FrsA (DUF1100 family)